MHSPQAVFPEKVAPLTDAEMDSLAEIFDLLARFDYEDRLVAESKASTPLHKEGALNPDTNQESYSDKQTALGQRRTTRPIKTGAQAQKNS